MPIAFSCSCGKAIKAKEAFAGRKIKCTQCGQVVTVPKLPVEEETRAVTPPPTESVARPALLEEKDAEHPELAATPPPATPVTPPVFPQPKADAPARPSPAPVHAWVDHSLVQHPTPWMPGDEERFGRGIKVPREGLSGLEKCALGLVVLCALGVAGWLLLMNK
jgi:hypothetical protein